MKYKIIPDDIVKNLIEFLDEIQFEAASSNKQEDLHRINFINWMISELMNGLDGFDTEDEVEDDGSKIIDRDDIINKYRKDLRKEFPDDMTEKEFKKLVQQFDAFITGWDKEYKKSNHKQKGKKNTLKDFENDLKKDQDLSPEEKFELYYDEHRNRQNEKGHTLNSMLKKLGIKRNPSAKK